MEKPDTGETRYNEILGTKKCCLLYQNICYQCISINNTNTKQVTFHWDRRKQFVISGILLSLSDLFILSLIHCITR